MEGPTNHGSTDDEVAAGVDVEDGLVVEILRGDDHLDDLLHHVLAELGQGDLVAVLDRDDDGVDADWDARAAVEAVLASHLSRENLN